MSCDHNHPNSIKREYESTAKKSKSSSGGCELVLWGNNSNGQLGVGNTLEGITLEKVNGF